MSVAYLFGGCDRNEPKLPIKDFAKFELNSLLRTYEFKDSVLQFCEPDFFNQNEFQFYLSKTYHSNDPRYRTLSIILKQLDKNCPPDRMENNLELTFILTEGNANDGFIDHTNFSRIDHIEWTQQYNNGKITLTGRFEGWVFKYYPVRSDELIEPIKLDSLLIEKGEFQLSTN